MDVNDPLPSPDPKPEGAESERVGEEGEADEEREHRPPRRERHEPPPPPDANPIDPRVFRGS